MAMTPWNQADLLARVRRAALRGLTGWIGLVDTRAVQLIMQPPKTGRVYRRRGVSHQASAPGEAPANDTGRLVNSRRIDLIEAQLRARLTFSTKYAAALELGTPKMEARPYARRALAETRQAGEELLRREIAEELRR